MNRSFRCDSPVFSIRVFSISSNEIAIIRNSRRCLTKMNNIWGIVTFVSSSIYFYRKGLSVSSFIYSILSITYWISVFRIADRNIFYFFFYYCFKIVQIFNYSYTNPSIASKRRNYFPTFAKLLKSSVPYYARLLHYPRCIVRSKLVFYHR